MPTDDQKIEILLNVASRIDDIRIQTSDLPSKSKILSLENISSAATATAVGGAAGSIGGLVGVLGLSTTAGLITTGSLILPGIGTLVGMGAAGYIAMSRIRKKRKRTKSTKEFLSNMLKAVQKDSRLESDIVNILESKFNLDNPQEIKAGFIELRILIEMTTSQNYLKKDASLGVVEAVEEFCKYPKSNIQRIEYNFNKIMRIFKDYPRFEDLINNLKQAI